MLLRNGVIESQNNTGAGQDFYGGGVLVIAQCYIIYNPSSNFAM